MIAPPTSYHERIIRDPAVLAGKPIVKGTRISVELILKHLSQNPDTEELLAAYPRLTIDDIRAALAYAQAILAGDELAPTAPSHAPSPATT